MVKPLGFVTKRLDEFSSRQKANAIDPYQQVLIEDYLKNNQDADFEGIPGYEIIQRRFNEKMKRQNPFAETGEKKEKSGKADSQTSSKISKEAEGNPDSAFMPGDNMRMGAKGFMQSQQKSRKDFIFDRIQEKKYAGEPLSINERAFEKKYLGISESTTGPQTAEDRLRIRNLAKSMAKTSSTDEFGLDEDFEPSEDQINDNMIEAAKFLYPNMDVDNDASFSTYLKTNKKEINLDITLPEAVTSTSQAVKFLTENGFSQEEAVNWLKSKRNAK